jgi:hypothetical protein
MNRLSSLFARRSSKTETFAGVGISRSTRKPAVSRSFAYPARMLPAGEQGQHDNIQHLGPIRTRTVRNNGLDQQQLGTRRRNATHSRQDCYRLVITPIVDDPAGGKDLGTTIPKTHTLNEAVKKPTWLVFRAF